MRVQVIGAASAAPGFPLSTFLIDEELAVDAGSLGWFAPVEVQSRIRHILLTHSHLDHIAGLPVLLDNVYSLPNPPPTVYGLPDTLDALERYLFNNVLMPDFVELSRKLRPFLNLRPVAVGQPFQIGSLRVEVFPVHHTVPTVGYKISHENTTVIIFGDTLDAPELARQLARTPGLRAVFLEASFPNEQAELAKVSCHLTAEQFLQMAREFGEVPVYAVHLKPAFVDQILGQLQAGGLKNVQAATPGLVVEV